MLLTILLFYFALYFFVFEPHFSHERYKLGNFPTTDSEVHKEENVHNMKAMLLEHSLVSTNVRKEKRLHSGISYSSEKQKLENDQKICREEASQEAEIVTAEQTMERYTDVEVMEATSEVEITLGLVTGPPHTPK